MIRKFRYQLLWLLGASLLFACALDPIGLNLQPGWKVTSVEAWKHLQPEDVVISADEQWLYATYNDPEALNTPSILRANLKNDRHHSIIVGLYHAQGLALDHGGSLWINEDFPQGLLWRIAEPQKINEEIQLDRRATLSGYGAIAQIRQAGLFSKFGMVTSADDRFLYLSEHSQQGHLFRLDTRHNHLEVLGKNGWLALAEENIPEQASHLSDRILQHPAGMTRMADGRLLIAESGTGKIFILDDRGNAPKLEPWLTSNEINSPVYLAWDTYRQWLWIADAGTPSRLLAWDGRQVFEVANHDKARIRGLSVAGKHLYFCLQRDDIGPQLILKLEETSPPVQ